MSSWHMTYWPSLAAVTARHDSFCLAHDKPPRRCSIYSCTWSYTLARQVFQSSTVVHWPLQQLMPEELLHPTPPPHILLLLLLLTCRSGQCSSCTSCIAKPLLDPRGLHQHRHRAPNSMRRNPDSSTNILQHPKWT